MNKTLQKNEVIGVKAPRRTELITIRCLILTGALSMMWFIWWFADPEHIGYGPVFWLLTFALLFKLVKMAHEWYHYWSPSRPEKPAVTRQYTVDVLTTACPGEPREMIVRTLEAMVNIRYPHTNYLCDEGDDPYLKKICGDLGVVHVTRQIKKDAKAGNINNALKQATGEICVVLDPDHVPIPEFLDRVLPFFEDEQIGFVQCVQAYGNQSESFVARGAAEQTYHFYGPIMMCMNTYGTVQAIGANCTFRRKALDSIGGHAAGLSEDMHTAMQLHAKGWKSVYVPEILTRGLVPATLSAYYKQQLKWSRGTFELLFRTYPKLKNNFTWRQKLHYFTIPLYFLFGLINLIDLVVPLLALGLARVPWEVDLSLFALYFLPLCGLSMIVRLYAQRWLLEKHEHGFHFAGGILRLATWWIFLIGFVYTIFKIKVPYIPTPKEDEHQNYIRLSVPNFLTLVVAAVLVYYGLSIDWTPYSIAMAGYSLMSAGMLGLTILMSQQKLLNKLSLACKKVPVLHSVIRGCGSAGIRSQQVVYHLLKNGPLMLLLAVSLLFASYSGLDSANEELRNEKKLGGFYYGSFPGFTRNSSALSPQSASLHQNLYLIEEPFADSVGLANHTLFQSIKNRGGIPYLKWNFTPASHASDSLSNELERGTFNEYLENCANFFRKYEQPLFISFVSESKDLSSSDFISSWQHLYTFFNNQGISNLTWVWCPQTSNSSDFYPGEKFVDWLGISCLNFASNTSQANWSSFSSIYEPYRGAYGNLKKPVMINSLGTVKGPAQEEWLQQAFTDITEKYREVKATLLFTGEVTVINKDKAERTVYHFDHAGTTTIQKIEKTLARTDLMPQTFCRLPDFAKPDHSYKSGFVKGTPGNYELRVNNEPVYIKGVAYNTAHDWRDGNMPLSRRQVEYDFIKIKAMGANTIRRYGMGVYDRNVLNIASEFNLDVLYGFWFDPNTDFFADQEKVQDYMAGVEEKVLEYRNHSSVIAWSLGNESWGLLKHRFAKPYLSVVRKAYIQMIEHLAQRIHELDPTRPVFTCIEHEEYQMPGELVAFRDGAPSIDVIGINSYYKEQISTLNHVAWQFDSLRPYLVSEFGPQGYWDPKYNNELNGSLIEQSDNEKAEWYKYQWSKYVQGYRGYNIGGFAYCWHDRMEGTFTWFGLTDYRGRPKAGYFALKEVWTGEVQVAPPVLHLSVPDQLLPGHTYTLSVSSAADLLTNNIEWRFLQNEYLEEVQCISKLDEPGKIALSVPEKSSDYRLYIHLADKNDRWVSTASLPVKVRSKNSH